MFPMPSMATEARMQHCQRLAVRLRQLGFDVDWRRVNRNYINMRRWEQGYLTLGQLVKQTGIPRKRKSGDT